MSKTLWATSLPRRGNLSCPPDGAPLGIGHGVVTGLLLLGFGFFAVEAWFRDREARRWTQVGYIAAKELGFVTDNLLRGMDYLLDGQRIDTEGIYIDPVLHQRLVASLDRYSFSQDDKISYRGRVSMLLGDREWVEVAVVVLDIVKHQHRRNLATWVPLIQTIDKMIPLINESAQINEAVFELQDILRVVNDPRDARFAREEIQRIAKDTPALHDAALRHWQNTYEGIMALPQKCMQTAQLHQWEHPYAQHGPVNDREHKT